MKTIWSVMLGLALTLPIHAGIVVLVDEDFSDLAVGGVDGGTWFTTDSGFELYDSGGFAPRGMSSLYGENAGGKTTSDAVPGGNEVLANSTDVELGFTVTLPGDLDDAFDGTLTFWAGQRIGGDSSGGFEHYVQVRNLTDSTDYVTQQVVNFVNYGWRYNQYALNFDADDAGDTLEVRWFESGGASDRGLQLADINLSVTTIPEPSTIGIVMATLGAAVIRRRRFG